jgi:hypothetical protein
VGLLVNGEYTAWTGDNPDGWVIINESGSDPEVTERDPNQTHADTATTGNAANFYSTASIFSPRTLQNVLTEGEYYESDVDLTAYAAGTMGLDYGSGGSIAGLTQVANINVFGRAVGVSFTVNTSSVPADYTVDSVSAKQITLNTIQTGFLNGSYVFRFTVPASPKSYQTIRMIYRCSGANNELYDNWEAYLQRNVGNTAWDARLDSVSAGTRANRINVTGVGTPTMIGVYVNGNDHKLYTGTGGSIAGATWTQRGGTITNTTHNTNTMFNTMYVNATTPTQLYASPKDIFS